MEAPAVTNTQATTGTNDVFSITDQALSDRLQFVQEIGFGNWGSVWLCRPKLSSSADGLARGQKIAVKLVHRSKTPTTAARVRSLWNEMKIIRNFKNDPHPSIIPFHSFVLTPSYALITMSYLPTLVPVEVEESKAKEWFRFLLSGVDFLHKRGVVHNDIKPANILLSHKNIPVLVDFGFAEKYDIDSPTAFHSNLSYGTPEYLSPERARGLPHDTRKSDVWSLGVTFFEILIGRTPFEHSDGEQFTSKEDLEQYWQRTLKGTWVGTWKISQEMEKFLQRMIASNADLRCTASQAMADEFWRPRHDSLSSHRRSSSYTSSVVFEKDMAKLLDLTPSSTRTMGRDNLMLPPGLDSPLSVRKDLVSPRPIAKSKSQPRVNSNKVPQQKKRAHVPAVDLSPIKASPPTTPSALGKENGNATPGRANGRKPFGILTTRNANVPVTAITTPSNKTFGPEDKFVKSFGHITHSGRRHSEDVQSRTMAERDNGMSKGRGKESTSVVERVRDWEREREKLREMARLEELEREQDEVIEREKESEKTKGKELEQVKKPKKISIREPEYDKENRITPSKTNINSTALSTCTPPPVLPLPALTTPLTQAVLKTMSAIPAEQSTCPKTSQGKKFGHVIRASIDRTLQVYKSSTLGQVTSGRSTPARSLDIDIKDAPNPNKDELPRPKGSSQAQPLNWENEVNSSLPVVRNAVQNERVAADSRMDRLNIWMQNVERVVEDARQNFAASARLKAPLPSLPVAPSSRSRNGSRNTANRSNYSSRLPRKVLAANEIFADYNSSLMADTSVTTSSSALGTSDLGTTPRTSIIGNTSPSAGGSTPPSSHPASVKSEGAAKQFLVPEIRTPSRQRRVTVSEDSPVAMRRGRDVELTPSKKRRNSARFLQQRIASFSKLEAEINKPIKPEPSPRLSEMFDRNVFIATPLRSYDNLNMSRDSFTDDLTASPELVEPYPSRKPSATDVLPDTPQLRRLEGVYDRFLMATSGVKRVGKGYQSEFVPTAANTGSNNSSGNNNNNRGIARRHSRALFGVGRTPMPPPVSSEDCERRGLSVDELGILTYGDEREKEEAGKKTVAFVKKAIKAIVPSAKSSKRHSKMVMV